MIPTRSLSEIINIYKDILEACPFKTAVAGGCLHLDRSLQDIDILVEVKNLKSVFPHISNSYPDYGFISIVNKSKYFYIDTGMICITGTTKSGIEVDLLFVDVTIQERLDLFPLSIQKVYMDSDLVVHGLTDISKVKSTEVFKFGNWQKAIDKYTKYYPEMKFIYPEEL